MGRFLHNVIPLAREGVGRYQRDPDGCFRQVIGFVIVGVIVWFVHPYVGAFFDWLFYDLWGNPTPAERREAELEEWRRRNSVLH